MSDSVIRYLDCVNRPLDFHNDSRIPDGLQQNSILLVDFFDDNGWSGPMSSASNTDNYSVIGVGAMYTIGPSNVRNQTYDIDTVTSRSAAGYGVVYFLIGDDNTIINWNADALTPSNDKRVKAKLENNAKKCVQVKHVDKSLHYKNVTVNKQLYANDVISVSSDGVITIPKENMNELKEAEVTQQTFFWSNDPSNIVDIMGDSDGFSTETALIDQFRLISAGIRFLPTIEVVTNSDTFAISRYYGSGITAATLTNASSNYLDIFQVMREGAGYNEYTNTQGISVRMNPCQEGLVKLTKMNALSNYSSTDPDFPSNTNNFVFPVIIAKFTSTVTIEPGGRVSAPFRSTFRTYVEGILKLPTAIITTRVNYDPAWEQACKAFTYDIISYPTVVAGHSFKKLARSFYKVANKIDPRLGMVVKGGAMAVDVIKKVKKAKIKKGGFQSAMNVLSDIRANYNNLGINRSNKVKPDLLTTKNMPSRNGKKKNKKKNTVEQSRKKLVEAMPKYKKKGQDLTFTWDPVLQHFVSE